MAKDVFMIMLMAAMACLVAVVNLQGYAIWCALNDIWDAIKKLKEEE